MVPRRIFVSKIDVVRGDWRITKQGSLRCVLLPTYYSGGTYDTNGEQERSLQAFGADTCGKRPLRRSRHRWYDNIEMYFQKVGWEAWAIKCGGFLDSLWSC